MAAFFDLFGLSNRDIDRIAEKVAAKLKPQLDTIMANTQETLDLITSLQGTIADIGTNTGATLTAVTQVRTDTQTLLQKIRDLQDAVASGQVDPRITAALAAVVDAANAVKTNSEVAMNAAKAADDAVPNEPTPPPAP